MSEFYNKFEFFQNNWFLSLFFLFFIFSDESLSFCYNFLRPVRCFAARGAVVASEGRSSRRSRNVAYIDRKSTYGNAAVCWTRVNCASVSCAWLHPSRILFRWMWFVEKGERGAYTRHPPGPIRDRKCTQCLFDWTKFIDDEAHHIFLSFVIFVLRAKHAYWENLTRQREEEARTRQKKKKKTTQH